MNDVALKELPEIEVNEANRWRLETPGVEGWQRTARPRDPNKYFMISADSHANEPPMLWHERIDKKYRDRLPKIWVDEKGVQWRKNEGEELPDRLVLTDLQGEDFVRTKSGATPEKRLLDHALDGIDGEVIFPNKGLQMWFTPDPVFAMAQCRVYNDWAWEMFGPHVDTLSPVACVSPGDIEGTMAEIERVAKLGFRSVTLPSKPMFGAHKTGELNYNKKEYEPMWSLIEELGLPITFHVSTGKDPRAARGPGGAVTNFVCHALVSSIEPIAHMCAAGVAERHPKLRFGIVEAGIGWLPWFLDAMDEAYLKHHFWVRPKLKALPSEYFRAQGFATFQEDRSGLATVEQFKLVDNAMWANDYPHHEGTWPHSSQAIERTMSGLSEESRAKILGLNAARVFGFKVPEDKAKAGQQAS